MHHPVLAALLVALLAGGCVGGAPLAPQQPNGFRVHLLDNKTGTQVGNQTNISPNSQTNVTNQQPVATGAWVWFPFLGLVQNTPTATAQNTTSRAAASRIHDTGDISNAPS